MHVGCSRRGKDACSNACQRSFAKKYNASTKGRVNDCNLWEWQNMLDRPTIDRELTWPSPQHAITFKRNAKQFACKSYNISAYHQQLVESGSYMLMRKALAILLIAVLVIVPCAGMNASQALASNQSVAGAHVDHGHSDSAQAHARVQTDATPSDSHHSDPKDCVTDCDSTVAQVAKPEDLGNVVVAFVSISIAYFVQLASEYLIPPSVLVSGSPPWASAADMVQSMSVLDRTTRLRN
jgi:hypothetical protein